MRVEPACPELSRRAGQNGARTSGNGEKDGPEFPSARYFQIHFEHIEELLGEARRCLDILRQQMADFQRNPGDDFAEKGECQVRKSTAGGPKLSLRGSDKPHNGLESGNPLLGTVSGK